MTGEPYNDWLETRRHIQVPDNFCREVMDAVHDRQIDDKRFRILHRNMWQQWFAAGGLLIAGLFRLAYIALHLMWPGSVAP
jgi:hypothetical protein